MNDTTEETVLQRTLRLRAEASPEQREAVRELTANLSRALTTNGQYVRTGWDAFRTLFLPPDASDAQINDMRIAFLAGCQHMWAGVNHVSEAEEEQALALMDRLNSEMESVYQELDSTVKKVEGG